jgi:NAD(P)-dependent dehydrogenase (short-subunit alcohol dehydrogenase family)
MANVLSAQRMVGKVALVTGAASGIGNATAKRLAEAGARVVLADLNEPDSAQVADAICAGGGQALAFRLDVTSQTDWQAAMARILAEWGRLDIAVNCAGIAFARPITDTSLADWRRVLATNLDGVFVGTRQAMSAMKEGGGGCIINIASAAGNKALWQRGLRHQQSRHPVLHAHRRSRRRTPEHPRQLHLSRCHRNAHVGIHRPVAQASRQNERAGCGLKGSGDR